MMKLYFDNIVFSLQRAGGISVYWCELLKRMMDAGVDFNVIERKGAEGNIFRRQLSFPRERVILERSICLKMLRYLPLMHSLPAGALSHSSYFRVSRSPGVVNVVTVYDFVYERFAPALKKTVHFMQKKYAVRHADGIICISHHTKKDLLEYFPFVDPSRVAVIHLGGAQEYCRLEAETATPPHLVAQIRKPYILFVGDRSYYKNFPLAVDVCAALPGYSLAVVGGGPVSKADEAILDKRIPGRFKLFGPLSNADLNVMYNNAHCLLYPSSYEGFGLPLLEAMKAGCPVVASNASSLPEVVGDAGFLVGGFHPDEYAAGIREIENSVVREAVVQKGLRRAAEFSFDRCFEETMAFYRRTLNEKRS